MKKKDRGHIDHRYDKRGKVIVIRWHDNSPVTIASNVYAVQPVDKAKRWSNATKKEIQVTQPAAVKQYNANIWVGRTGWTRMSAVTESVFGPRNGGGPCSYT